MIYVLSFSRALDEIARQLLLEAACMCFKEDKKKLDLKRDRFEIHISTKWKLKSISDLVGFEFYGVVFYELDLNDGERLMVEATGTFIVKKRLLEKLSGQF